LQAGGDGSLYSLYSWLHSFTCLLLCLSLSIYYSLSR
jgi:hypothetical protein